MKIYFEKEDETREIEFSGTVAQLLDTLKLNTEEVLVVKGDDAVLEDEQLTNADSVKILSVISGG